MAKFKRGSGENGAIKQPRARVVYKSFTRRWMYETRGGMPARARQHTGPPSDNRPYRRSREWDKTCQPGLKTRTLVNPSEIRLSASISLEPQEALLQ